MSKELKKDWLPKLQLRYERRNREGKSRMLDELCADYAPGNLQLKARRQLQERYASLDPFDLKDELEEQLKQILHPRPE